MAVAGTERPSVILVEGRAPEASKSAALCSLTSSQRLDMRRTLLLLSSAFMALWIGNLQVFAGASSVSPSDERMFEEAMRSMDRSDFAHAEALLRDLFARHPDNFEINESLGLACAALHEYQAALSFFKRAVSERPDLAATHANLGTTYIKIGDGASAVRELSVTAQLAPDTVRTEEALGQAWMLAMEPHKALAAFAAALKMDSQNPDLLYNIALASDENGDLAQAAAYLSEMPGLKSSSSAQSLYGDIEEKLGDYQKAAEHYALAVTLEPSEANIYSLGVDFLRHWSFEPAEKELEAGTKRFPESTRMRFALGVAYYGGEDYDRAIPVLADLLKSHADNKEYARMLGLACAHLSEGVDPRCSAVMDFAQKHPGDGLVATYVTMSILHQQVDSNQLKAAQHLLEIAIRSDPALPDSRFELGLLLQEEGQWEKSIRELQAAIRMKPDYPHAHYRLALAYSRTGRKEQAKIEAELDKNYTEQAAADLDQRMNRITTLLVSMK